MRLIAAFVILVLLTGVMMMSISYDAFAGQGEKLLNITVKDNNGKAVYGVECKVFQQGYDTQLGITKFTNNGGKAGIMFPDTFDIIDVKCGTADKVVLGVGKHTSAVLIIVN